MKLTNNILFPALIIALIQFANALEYMMISPLFPFMSVHLNIPESFSGYVTGSYTASSLISGFAAFFFIDRCNKKRVLLLNMLALCMFTLITPFAQNISLLLLLRILAGLFGGITLGVGMGLLINITAESERSKVIDIVISAFSFVSILGLPSILFITHLASWQYAFWLVALICAIGACLVQTNLPNDNQHLQKGSTHKILVMNKNMFVFSLAGGIANFSPFLLIPILVPIFTHIIQITSNMIPLLFFIGGLASLVGTKSASYFSYRLSDPLISTLFTTIFMVNIGLLLMNLINAYLFIILFMFSTYGRLATASIISSYFTTANNRAGFNVLQTSFTNLLSTFAFFIPSVLLGHQSISLTSIQLILILCLLSAAPLPFYIMQLKRRLMVICTPNENI